MDMTGDTRGTSVVDTVRRTVESVQNALTVRRVYGEPFEKDGITVIPAAALRGGGGGGGGGDTEGNSGGGTGFGLTARPIGAYVIRDGQVRWEPAFDLTRVAVLAQVAVIVAFLSIRSIGRARARARLAEARGGQAGGVSSP